MDSEKLRYNSLSYFIDCINKYSKAHHLNIDGWKVVSIGTGTAYDSWHYNITIQSPSGMEKTIRVPMYQSKQDNFNTYFINEC